MHDALKIKDQEPVSSGQAKDVYQHPTDPTVLVKVVKPTARAGKRPAGMLFRLSRHWEYATEIIEYLAAKEVAPDGAHYLEKVIGLADTDLGVGLMVKAIKTKEGGLAPTVFQLASTHGLSETQHDALESIFDWVSSANLIVRDFSTNNLLWDEQAGHFVIIDGVGAKPAYSLRPFWRAYNIHSNRKKVGKLRSRVQNVLKTRSKNSGLGTEAQPAGGD